MTRKNLHRPAFVIAFSIAFILTFPTAALAEETAYTDPELRFSFTAPDGWVAYNREELDSFGKADSDPEFGDEYYYFAGFHPPDADYPRILYEHDEDDVYRNSTIDYSIARGPTAAIAGKTLAERLEALCVGDEIVSWRLKASFSRFSYETEEGESATEMYALFPGKSGSALLYFHSIGTDSRSDISAFIEAVESAAFKDGYGFDAIPQKERSITPQNCEELSLNCSFDVPPEWNMVIDIDPEEISAYSALDPCILGCGECFGIPDEDRSSALPNIKVLYRKFDGPMTNRIAKTIAEGSGSPLPLSRQTIINLTPGTLIIDPVREMGIFVRRFQSDQQEFYSIYFAIFPGKAGTVCMQFTPRPDWVLDDLVTFYYVLDSFSFDEDFGYEAIPDELTRAPEGPPVKVINDSAHYSFELPIVWEEIPPVLKNVRFWQLPIVKNRTLWIDGTYWMKDSSSYRFPLLMVARTDKISSSPWALYKDLEGYKPRTNAPAIEFEDSAEYIVPTSARISNLKLDRERNTVCLEYEADNTDVGTIVLHEAFIIGRDSSVIVILAGLKPEAATDRALFEKVVLSVVFDKRYEHKLPFWIYLLLPPFLIIAILVTVLKYRLLGRWIFGWFSGPPTVTRGHARRRQEEIRARREKYRQLDAENQPPRQGPQPDPPEEQPPPHVPLQDYEPFSGPPPGQNG